MMGYSLIRWENGGGGGGILVNGEGPPINCDTLGPGYCKFQGEGYGGGGGLSTPANPGCVLLEIIKR